MQTCVRASLTLAVSSVFGAEVIREGSCCRTSRRLASSPSSMAATCSAPLPEPRRMPLVDSHALHVSQSQVVA